MYPMPKSVAEMMPLVNSAKSLVKNPKQEVVFDRVEEEVVVYDPGTQAKFKEAMIDHDSNARARSPRKLSRQELCPEEGVCWTR